MFHFIQTTSNHNGITMVDGIISKWIQEIGNQISETQEDKALKLILTCFCLKKMTQGKVLNHLGKYFGISTLLCTLQQHLKEFDWRTKINGMSHKKRFQFIFE